MKFPEYIDQGEEDGDICPHVRHFMLPHHNSLTYHEYGVQGIGDNPEIKQQAGIGEGNTVEQSDYGAPDGCLEFDSCLPAVGCKGCGENG